MNEVLDMGKGAAAGAGGVSVWYVQISQALQLSISVACLTYLICKCYFLIKNKGK